MVPDITTTKSLPTMFPPLLIIIIISMCKAGFENYQNYKSDQKENLIKVKLLNSQGKLEEKCQQDLRVGDIIKIVEDEYCPADVMLLTTSDPAGRCFIETKNLDGETNLKQKTANSKLCKVYGDRDKEEKLSRNKLFYSFQKPNPFINSFYGTIRLPSGEIENVNNDNIFLRGCSLKNTQYIYGVVTYTGHFTKIMLNSVNSRLKQSKVEIQTNQYIIFIFFFQIASCMIGAFLCFRYEDHNESASQDGYLELRDGVYWKDNILEQFLIRMGNWILLFSQFLHLNALTINRNMIPISLLVNLEMVKFFQGQIMNRDPKMCAKETETYAHANNSNLNEELGQISYIFSDKTGTLTQNNMDFRCACVAGLSYGEERDMTEEELDHYENIPHVDFKDRSFFKVLKGQSGEDMCEEALLCHTVIVEEKNGERRYNVFPFVIKIMYQAASPDDLALLNFTRFCGFHYLGIDEKENMIIEYKGNQEKYQLLEVLEFNSTRKRMSVIVKDKENKIWLYSKGADNKLFERMKKPIDHKLLTQNNLLKFSTMGLRTLVVAQREISEDEYNTWHKEYEKAKKSKDRKEKMMEVQEKIEVDLTLIGATGIDDKLQEDVGITIQKIKQAGIKIWVLTGDKIETAINIGFSCKLLDHSLKQQFIRGKDKEEVKKELVTIITQQEKLGPNEHYALIISGDSLIHITCEQELLNMLMKVAEKCKAVLGCRVSPKQKAEIVKMVRDAKPEIQTLAIGDGANDVNMIIAAHVGVGIKGVEGHHASKIADYSIGQFKFLRRLLLSFGRESLRKNANLICYNFYKNMLLSVPLFLLGLHSGWGGSTFYDDQFNLQLYNLFYTSMPITIYALMDKEVKGDVFVDHPHYYIAGRKGKIFNAKKFWSWLIWSFIQGTIVYFLITYAFNNIVYSEDGKLVGYWFVGICIYSFVILIANFNVLIISFRQSILLYFTVFISFVVYIVLFKLMDSWFEFIFLTDNIYYGVLEQFIWQRWLIFFAIFGLTTMPDYANEMIQCNFILEILNSLDFKHVSKKMKIAEQIKEVTHKHKEEGGEIRYSLTQSGQLLIKHHQRFKKIRLRMSFLSNFSHLFLNCLVKMGLNNQASGFAYNIPDMLKDEKKS